MLVQRELGTFAKKVRRAIQVSRTYQKRSPRPQKNGMFWGIRNFSILIERCNI